MKFGLNMGVFVCTLTLMLWAVFPTMSFAQTTQNTTLSEQQKIAQLEALLDQLFELLEQLYPQIDWDVFRGSTTDDDDAESEEDSDEDSDEDSNDEDDEDDDEPTAEAPVGSNEARAEYRIPFSMEAFGEDLFIRKTAGRSATVSTSVGVTYALEDASGTTYVGGTASGALSSGDTSSGDTNNYFKVGEDSGRTFVLHVSLNNDGDTQGYYRVRIVGVAFDEDTSAGGEDTLTSVFTNYRTPEVFVDDSNN